jgi:integrase
VFCGKKSGASLATIQRTWERIRKKAGIPEFRIHDLRHSIASFMIKNGVSLFELSKLLGHKSINTTMRYAHLADKELVGVTNKGGKMFEANNKYFA